MWGEENGNAGGSMEIPEHCARQVYRYALLHLLAYRLPFDEAAQFELYEVTGTLKEHPDTSIYPGNHSVHNRYILCQGE